MGRSIRDLKPQEVLSLAIAVESRNAQRYDSFAVLFAGHSDDASSLFIEMRDEELAHQNALQIIYRSRFGGFRSLVCAVPCRGDNSEWHKIDKTA